MKARAMNPQDDPLSYRVDVGLLHTAITGCLEIIANVMTVDAKNQHVPKRTLGRLSAAYRWLKTAGACLEGVEDDAADDNQAVNFPP